MNGSVQWSWNQHTFKGGAEFGRYGRFLNATTVGRRGVHLDGFDHLGRHRRRHLHGFVHREPATSTRSTPATSAASSPRSTPLPNRAQFYASFDTNGNGTITDAELAAALRYNSTAGNPNGQFNYFRIAADAGRRAGLQGRRHAASSSRTRSAWHASRSTWACATEQWKHFASEGTKIFTFDWALAPRLSRGLRRASGDGRQKAFAYYGRYYDPIRTNMTAFAGSISGRVREEQVFANNQWVNYRTRGGTVAQDAFIAPTTKTPYTDDITVGYQADLGRR